MDLTHIGNASDQSSNFAWRGEPLMSDDKYNTHYGGFCKGESEVAVNSFVLVLSKEFHHIGYIQDLFEDKKGSRIAKLRWFHRHREVKGLFPDLVRKSEEIYIIQTIQLIDVETIDSIAYVLTADHYNRCLDVLSDLSDCGIYMCRKEIADGAIQPFDISQLPGYSSQGILSLLHTSTTSLSTSTADFPFGNNPSMQFAKRARSQRQKKRKIVHSGDSNSVSLSAAQQQIANSDASICLISGNETMEYDQMPQKQIANSDASICSISGYDRMPLKMKLKKLMHSNCSELDGSVSVEVWSCEYENFEVLSPRFPRRWLRCQILLKSPKIIVVKYHDGEAGNLEEVLPPPGMAPPDKLGMRLAGRTTLRPSPPQNSSNNSFQLGESVDVWLHRSWCEGVFISPGDISTTDRFLVYLPGENILETFHMSDLRVSKDWINDEWKEIPHKLDILSVISSMLAATNANPEMTV